MTPPLPWRVAGDAAAAIKVLTRSGLVSPVRPDRLLGMALSFGRWGLSPAAAYAAGAARDPHRVAVQDDRESVTDAERRLRAALATARALADRGVTFVVAPVPSRAGEVLESIDDRYVVAVYRYVHGRAHPWSPYPDRAARSAIVDGNPESLVSSPVVLAVAPEFARAARERISWIELPVLARNADSLADEANGEFS